MAIKRKAPNKKRDTNSVDLSGKKINYLVAIEPTEYRAGSQIMWRCRCVCGREDFLARSSVLKSGRIKSCGCMTKRILSGARTSHGMSGGITYKTWRSVKERCLNPSHKSYGAYGGAGVKVCDRWLNFQNFVADMGERPGKEYSIDRIDGSKGYEPGNCRWATTRQQAQNRKSSVLIRAFGRQETASQWSRLTGINDDVIRKRIYAGWAPEMAVSKPPRKQKNTRHSDMAGQVDWVSQ